MHRTETHLCELSFCAKPCEFTTICHKHVDELQDELTEFSTDEKLRLFAIARGEEKPADQTKRSSGKGQTVDVLSIPTWTLAMNIHHHWPHAMPYLAQAPKAAKQYWIISNGIQEARHKINGLYPDHQDPEYQKAMLQVRYPRKAGDLIEHMWDHYRIRISHSQLRKWTQRGKLQPIEVEGSNHHLYNPKQVLELM